MGNLLQELKRRNVYKVTTLYVVAGWVLLQVGDVVLPIFELPDSILRIPTLVLIAGFPIVVVLSWIYDFTAEGIVRTKQDTAATTTPAFGTDLIVIFLLFVIVGFSMFERFSQIDVLSGLAGSPQDTEPLPVRRYSLNLGPAGFNGIRGLSTNFAISPDGSRLAYFLFEGRFWNLYLRELDELEPRALNASATLGVENPGLTFSPDGESLLYTSISGLRKIAIQDGSDSEVVTEEAMQQGNYGATWAGDEIFFVTRYFSVHRVPAAGGESTALSLTGVETVLGSSFPQVLPDGEAMLLTVGQGSSTSAFQTNIALLSTDSGQATILVSGATNPRYVNSGHILFIRSGSLWAVPFDAQQRQIVGEEVELPIAIEGLAAFSFRNYTVSDNGLFIYQPASDITPEQRVAAMHRSVPVWVDRSGQDTPVGMPAAIYYMPHLSKGDQRLAVRMDNSIVGEATSPDIWSYEFDRDLFQRLTYGEIADDPQWTPDGQQLAYQAVFKNNTRWLISADGTGEPQPLTQLPGSIGSFTPDGNSMVHTARNPDNGTVDLYQLSLGDEPVSRPLLESNFDIAFPSVSPSGRWIAYYSRETGRGEIYVRPYPNVNDGKWQISSNWGVEPKWREDEGELYYRQFNPDPTAPRTIWAVPLETEPEFSAGVPQALFTGNFTDGGFGPSYDVNESGDQFLMLKRATEAGNETDSVSLVVVENWFEELKQLAPRDPEYAE